MVRSKSCGEGMGSLRAFFFPQQVRLKKSGTKLPRVVLEEIGPSADLLLDRGKPAEPTMWKASLKAAIRCALCS